MLSDTKALLKKIMFWLHLDISHNQKYDRQLLHILRKVLREDSNCIDIGCHKGDILRMLLKYAPNGLHFAAEPIPELFKTLQKKFPQKNVHLFPVALSNQPGRAMFNLVENDPAYSGLKKRAYKNNNPQIREIEVEINTLDQIIPEHTPISLIKIDVEGAELDVLRGGVQTIKRNKPYVIFEFGLGASEFYQSDPQQMYDFFRNQCNMQISLMKGWLIGEKPLNRDAFFTQYHERKNCYFMAHP